MTLEIQGNDYKFLIDKEKAKGNDATQTVWTKRLNKQNKGLMNAADFYAFAKFAYKILNHNGNQPIKDECNQLFKSIQQDFNDDYIITGSGICKRKGSSTGQIIHNKGSRIIPEKRIDVDIPTYNGDELADLIETKEGRKLVQAIFLTNDKKDKILDLIKFLGDYKTSRLHKKKDTNYSSVLLDGDDYIFGISYGLLNLKGCARAVSYIGVADTKNITLNDIITRANLT